MPKPASRSPSAAARPWTGARRRSRAPASPRRRARCARRSAGRASRPCHPTPLPASGRSRRRVPRRARTAALGLAPPGGLLAEDREVAVHEADDRHEEARDAQRTEASTRSGNGVVNDSRRAAWTLTQLLRAIVANSRRPWPLIVRTIGPSSIVASGSPGRVKIERQGRQHERQGEERRPGGRSGPRRARAESPARASHAMASAANDPTGRRLIETMNATVRMNFSRASARGRRCRGRGSGRGSGQDAVVRFRLRCAGQEPAEHDHARKTIATPRSPRRSWKRCRRDPGSCSPAGCWKPGSCPASSKPFSMATESRPSGSPEAKAARARRSRRDRQPTTHQ